MVATCCVDLLYMAWNRLEFTRETFTILLVNTDWQYVNELFVYDDGSIDGTQEWLEENIHRVPVPVRFFKTNNRSVVTTMLHWIESSNAPILAKTDSDAMLPPAWLRLSLEVFDLHPELMLLGVEAMHPHSNDPGLVRSYTPSEFISGLGLYRRSIFDRGKPAGFDVYFGFEEWQMAQGPGLVRGWIKPALPVFLLDRFPFEPWSTYSETYSQRGWQRPWGRYNPNSSLWCWRWPSLAPPFLPSRPRHALTLRAPPVLSSEISDLNGPWPWADDSFDHIIADDVLSYFPNKIRAINELWRVLRAWGTAEISILTTDGQGAFQDPSFVSFWNQRSFLYFQAGSPYRDRFAEAYGIQAKFRVLENLVAQTQDGPRLRIVLQAIKRATFKVVILSKWGTNLAACVRSILANEPELRPDHIVVVDDGAREGIDSDFPAVHWVQGIKPFNYARNVNVGIRAAETDIVLMDDDARLLTPSGFSLLARQLESQPYLGICSAGIRGIVGNPRQVASAPSQFRWETLMLAFICIYIPRIVFDRIGPLDERFSGYGCADADYCARLTSTGLRLGIWDGCVVDHSGESPSTYRTQADFLELYQQNRRLFREKWGYDL